MNSSTLPPTTDLPTTRIHFWEHGRAVRQMWRAYPPGVDAMVDRIRTSGPITRRIFRLLLPLYFAREQGWAVRGPHGEMVAMMYLRRNARQGIRVLHIDDINVDARYHRRGLAQRLMRLAEELARREQRPFLKLAVTVANTPAVTLYRGLGYREQRHRYFTYDSSASALRPPPSTDLNLRPLRRRQAAQDLRQFYQMEVTRSQPDVADMLMAYYPLDVPKSAKQMYAIERGGQQIGYGDVHRRDGHWSLDLALRPDVWAGETERQAIQLLTSAAVNLAASASSKGADSTVALHVPSVAHFDALCAGAHALERELGFTAQTYDRMIMVNALGITT
jgi:ribosomal protein S18 acetylase RimI-like enzyme